MRVNYPHSPRTIARSTVERGTSEVGGGLNALNHSTIICIQFYMNKELKLFFLVLKL